MEIEKKHVAQENIFGVGIRKNPKGYPGYPEIKWLYPCFILLYREDGHKICVNPEVAKDWMVYDQGNILVVTAKKKYVLSRREISHIYGPFKFDEMKKSVSSSEASNLLNMPEEVIKQRLLFQQDVSLATLQSIYGPLSIFPKEEQYRYKTIVKDIYRTHSGPGWISTTNYSVDEPIILKELEEYLATL